MKIIKNELKNSGITKSINLLTECASNLDQVMLSLDSFIDDSRLKSASYDKIRSMVEQYKELLSKDKELTGEFSQLINSTTSNMATFMDEFDEIDDSKKEEISASITNLKNSIWQYNNDIQRLSNDDDGSNDINAIIQAKNNAQANLEYFNKQLDKIKSLAPFDNSQYSQLDSVSNSLASMETSMVSLK